MADSTGGSSGIFAKALALVLPRSQKKGGLSLTGTYTPAATTAVLPIPSYQDHLQDIFTSRTSSDARALMQQLAQQDPDVSATFNAYLTISNTCPVILAKDPTGQIDPAGMALVQQLLLVLTKQFDYTQGFAYKPSLETITTEMKYMLMMRGAIASELVFDKNLAPSSIRHTDPQYLFFWEKLPGQYKPELRQAGQIIELDIPSFFISYYHRDPSTIYPASPFVASINTIAARQQVVNDLYRIMKVTGYPRLDVKVLEEIILKNAPATIRAEPAKLKEWLNARMGEIANTIAGLRPDQALIHWDSMEVDMVNDRKPGMEVDITPVIDVLNDQNQAALKTMGTIIGRGESGVNTASVEARVFSMNCDELNRPVAEILSNIFSLALRMQGYQGYVEVYFKPAELRPATELEPHLTMRASRLKEDLSLGLISDMEYSMEMYNRPPVDGAPTLQGTGFMQPETSTGQPDANAATAPSSGGDSLARSATSPGGKSATSKTVKKAKR